MRPNFRSSVQPLGWWLFVGALIGVLVSSENHHHQQNDTQNQVASSSGQPPQEMGNQQDRQVTADATTNGTSGNTISDDTGDSDNDMWSMVASMNRGGGSSAASQFTASTKEAEYDWHLKLDDDNRYSLDWTIHYGANQIVFSLDINQSASNFRPGSDVFALGFSERGERLAGSDFCLIWYDLSHRVHLQDARILADGQLRLMDGSRSQCRLTKESRSTSPEDAAEDSKEGEEEDELDGRVELERFARVVFKRPLEVCEAADWSYYHIDNGTTHLVWFTLRGPVLALEGLNLTELAAKKRAQSSGATSTFDWGMKRVQLLASRSKLAAGQSRAGSRQHDIRLDRFEVPARETTYWCKLFKLPARFQRRRYHITRYEAQVERGNEHVVHHMELFNCATGSQHNNQSQLDALWAQGGWAGECGSSSRPPATNPCRRVLLAWAMGAHPLEYPEEAGQSVGGAHFSPYVVLEVHYNNPAKLAGITDSSGLRFHYTGRLRRHDAGVLEVGLEYTDRNSAPPGLLAPLAGHCLGECTRAAMSSSRGDAGGIRIFAAQMHTHLAGVASWTELVRGGRLVRELQRDDHYSPHFQEIRLLPEPVELKPGDSLVHYCLYDTRERSNITLGGFATSDEMCVTYLHYYPRIDLEVCKSSIDSRSLLDYFAYMAEAEGQRDLLSLSSKSSQKDASESSRNEMGFAGARYRRIEWSRRRGEELLELYANAPLQLQCQRADGRQWPGEWAGLAPARRWDHLATAGGPPHKLRWPAAQELAAYRGDGHRRRHAQCARSSMGPPPMGAVRQSSAGREPS